MAVRILVVDDDRAVRESLRRSLSFNGYSVELAQDGQEALERITSDRPDTGATKVDSGKDGDSGGANVWWIVGAGAAAGMGIGILLSGRRKKNQL